MQDPNAPFSPDRFYAPPLADEGYVRAPDEAPMLFTAGFGIRAAARIVDTLIGMGLGFAMGFVIGLVQLGHQQVGFSLGRLGLALVGPIFYHSISEWLTGATIGKLICGLRVRNEQGNAPSLGGTIVRSVFYFIDALFCALVAYLVMKSSPRQQRLGDALGHTIVVVKGAAEPTPNLAGIFLGLAAWAACVALGAMM